MDVADDACLLPRRPSLSTARAPGPLRCDAATSRGVITAVGDEAPDERDDALGIALRGDLADGHTRHVLAAILTIGNEIVSGDTENTNASWLARRLEELGVKVVLSAAVPDELDRIVEFVRRERAARRPPDRHRRARRDARRHHARGARRRVRRPAGGRPGARRRPAVALHGRPGLRQRGGRRCRAAPRRSRTRSAARPASSSRTPGCCPGCRAR